MGAAGGAPWNGTQAGGTGVFGSIEVHDGFRRRALDLVHGPLLALFQEGRRPFRIGARDREPEFGASALLLARGTDDFRGDSRRNQVLAQGLEGPQGALRKDDVRGIHGLGMGSTRVGASGGLVFALPIGPDGMLFEEFALGDEEDHGRGGIAKGLDDRPVIRAQDPAQDFIG